MAARRQPAPELRYRRSVRRILLGLAALAAFSLVLIGGHLYLASRLISGPGWPEPWPQILTVLGAVLGVSLVLQPLGERLLVPRYARLIAWPASIWMGLAFLLLMFLLVSDLALWLGASVATAASGPTSMEDATHLARLRAAFVGLTAVAAVAVGMRSGLAPPQLRRVVIPLDRWPHQLDGFRIVQISDIHIGPILDRRFARHITDRVNALAPDIVAVTGDLVDGSAKALREEVEPFADLRGRHGVFFVTGNHDHYSNAREWTERVAELGMRVLRNERVDIIDAERGGASFQLAGVDDHHAAWVPGESGEDLARALEGRDPERAVVLMAHDPSTFKQASRPEYGVDLQISGHTHGGQIWPFAYFVRAAIPFVAGLYRRGDAQLYVSRGTGFWGPPMRLGAPAEITEITLRSAASARS